MQAAELDTWTRARGWIGKRALRVSNAFAAVAGFTLLAVSGNVHAIDLEDLLGDRAVARGDHARQGAALARILDRDCLGGAAFGFGLVIVSLGRTLWAARPLTMPARFVVVVDDGEGFPDFEGMGHGTPCGPKMGCWDKKR